MDLTLIKNCRFYTGNEALKYGDLLFDHEKILRIGQDIIPETSATIIEAQGNLVTPGFIDLQVNGGSNVFFNSNLQIESLKQILFAHEKYGTRFILPTLITCELKQILKAIQVVKEAMKDNSGILGLHLEGPFLNPAKPGAHNKSFIRKPSDAEIDIILEEGEGVIKKITIAPEIFSDTQLRKLADSKAIIAAGHSNATYEQALNFFSKGVNCVTHLYNAMSPFQSKSPGLVGATLTSDVFAGIIADGLHVHYSAVEMAYNLKKENLFLVSDASFTNIPDMEKADLAGIEVSIRESKIYTKEGNLAGASITLSDAIKNCVNEVKISEAEAIRMATKTPARLLGLENKLGQVKVGNSSKLNLLDQDLNLIRLI